MNFWEVISSKGSVNSLSNESFTIFLVGLVVVSVKVLVATSNLEATLYPIMLCKLLPDASLPPLRIVIANK